MDNLEQIVRSRRQAFDDKEPRSKLWDRIEADLDQKESHWGWLWKAAVLVLIPVCGFLIWERGQYYPAQPQHPVVQIDPEFEETEMYYSQMINEKKMLIDNFKINDLAIKEEFQRDLASLDSLYLELKTEFIETNNTSVVDAMIYNLQLRMDLLNRQIMILEKIDQYKHEDISVINS